MEVLRLSGICKSFGMVKVLQNVDFSLQSGEVHAIVGENGAGKSTLMKIIMGTYQPDAGKIILDGKEVKFQNTRSAMENGISMIYQELNSIPYMTVADNIFVGREPSKYGFVQKKQLFSQCQKLVDDLNIKLSARDMVKNLSVSERQMLEIVKAVSYHSKIIIMDEPTSSIADADAEILFEIIERLKKQGIAIIYISHKLDELIRIADRVTVLRDGYMINSYASSEFDANTIISDMVGREIQTRFPQIEKTIGEPVLKVEHLTAKGQFQDISFELKRGEILGFSGLIGSGRTEIITAIFGLNRYDSGKIYLNGEEVEIHCPDDAIRHHIAMVSEDRKLTGLNLMAPLKDNITVAVLKTLSKLGMIQNKKEKEAARKMMDELNVRASSEEQIAGSLSGGNQQKVVLAKWLLTQPEIILLDEPTRGIDVGAKAEIYKLINQLAKEGKSVLVISSEMPEIIGLCDRVIVLSDGHIKGSLDKSELSQQRIMECISK